jgi:DNA-binding transcriptional LysR family regulator
MGLGSFGLLCDARNLWRVEKNDNIVFQVNFFPLRGIIDLNQNEAMTTFVEVAKAGSFSNAAAKLGLSTTAVSRRVGELEQMLGVTLLRRTTRKVSMTEEGANYLARASAILEEIERLNNEISAVEQVPRGHLKITAAPAIGRELIAPLATDFLESFPEVSLDIELSDRFVDLTAEGFDAAIRSGHLASSSMIAHRIFEMTYRLCASPEYLERNGTPQKPSDIASHHCIYWRDALSSGRLSFTRCEQTISVPVRHRLQMTDFATQHDAVLRGLGLGILPEMRVREDLKVGRLVALLEGYKPYSGIVSLVRPNTPFVPAKLRAFIDFVTEGLRRRVGSRT